MRVCGGMERVKGIEPSYAAWEAAVLPLNYTRRRTLLTGTNHWLAILPSWGPHGWMRPEETPP